jgi:hypothetical protein
MKVFQVLLVCRAKTVLLAILVLQEQPVQRAGLVIRDKEELPVFREYEVMIVLNFDFIDNHGIGHI